MTYIALHHHELSSADGRLIEPSQNLWFSGKKLGQNPIGQQN